MEKDRVEVKITLTRNENGSVSRELNMTGEGFFLYEVVGMMQYVTADLIRASEKQAKELPREKKVRIKYNSDQNQ